MNSIIFISIIAVLLVIILVLLIILIKNKSSNSSKKNTSHEHEHASKFDFSNVKLPNKIDNFDSYTLTQACTAVFDTFKVLDYNSSQSHALDREEWHVWQVSMLLRMIRLDKEFYIPTEKNTFHESITSMSNDEIIHTIQAVLNRYGREINVKRSKDELCKEMFCTGREISCIFYFLAFRKSF